MRKPLVGAVIAAGGMAQRMQGIDKQQLVIGGVPVLARSILALGQVEQVGEIVVVTKPELFETLEDWKEQYHLPPFLLAAGGSTIESTPDRSRLYLTQTPQIFSLELYKKAVRQAQQEKLDFTDDCQLV